jgi:hypothetical protein
MVEDVRAKRNRSSVGDRSNGRSKRARASGQIFEKVFISLEV